MTCMTQDSHNQESIRYSISSKYIGEKGVGENVANVREIEERRDRLQTADRQNTRSMANHSCVPCVAGGSE